MQLFLSYVRQEQEAVEAFAERLRRSGFEVFLDSGLTGGQRWWNELMRQIQQCDAFLPILTKGYMFSRPCKLEVAYAGAVEKPILPVQIAEISPRLLSPIIGDIQ
ncbi:MAG TPA: toll/interleukin-1 receptor domain-containing protein, partial [Acidimicrobiales bacterium]|nr:toll/interleukin-1 receptor domain-containing protein [Acidimicrobiales bacterium]